MNIYVRAAAMARSNLGNGFPTVEELREHKEIVSVQEGVDFMLSDMIETDTYDIILREAEGWKQILTEVSAKQCHASWPDAMKLFEEAGV